MTLRARFRWERDVARSGRLPRFRMNIDGKVDGPWGMTVKPLTERIEDAFVLSRWSFFSVLCDISCSLLLRRRDGRRHFFEVRAPSRGTMRVPCAGCVGWRLPMRNGLSTCSLHTRLFSCILTVLLPLLRGAQRAAAWSFFFSAETKSFAHGLRPPEEDVVTTTVEQS